MIFCWTWDFQQWNPGLLRLLTSHIGCVFLCLFRGCWVVFCVFFLVLMLLITCLLLATNFCYCCVFPHLPR
jgi:hypothetical protein